MTFRSKRESGLPRFEPVTLQKFVADLEMETALLSRVVDLEGIRNPFVDKAIDLLRQAAVSLRDAQG